MMFIQAVCALFSFAFGVFGLWFMLDFFAGFLHPFFLFVFAVAAVLYLLFLLKEPLAWIIVGLVLAGRGVLIGLNALLMLALLLPICIGAGSFTPLLHPFVAVWVAMNGGFDDLQTLQSKHPKIPAKTLTHVYLFAAHFQTSAQNSLTRLKELGLIKQNPYYDKDCFDALLISAFVLIAIFAIVYYQSL